MTYAASLQSELFEIELAYNNTIAIAVASYQNLATVVVVSSFVASLSLLIKYVKFAWQFFRWFLQYIQLIVRLSMRYELQHIYIFLCEVRTSTHRAWHNSLI
jgi:hypothetical protein